ncbi:hypothetical protein TRIP_B350450 [uncultured Desulfatiglans sp.]|uniref:Uncharacterized protein n=1 Tax=Uncultured Desulfatiglans sp. TaxID=1748965 RepID=A0A653AC64_UNCDX|nr:hypothetical protein TRIP_B350450 [uncultured Desulfatiglans sp.]
MQFLRSSLLGFLGAIPVFFTFREAFAQAKGYSDWHTGPWMMDVWAWTCDGKVPGSKIRLREGDYDPDRAGKISHRKIHYPLARRSGL